MLNNTCRMLSAGYKFVAAGDGFDVKPCCLYKTGYIVKTKQELDYWRERINKVDSRFNPNCRDCNFLESTGMRDSRRELGFKHIPETASVGDPSFIEIQIDTTCNGGCIMCGPRASSYWAQELKINFPSKKIDYLDLLTDLVDLNKSEFILLLGGEPMLSDVDERLIHIIEDTSKVTLQYTTNGSIFPTDERMKLWEKFKAVNINVSIDGVGDKFEYIRYPLKWNKVEQNFLKMCETYPDNVRLKINHAVNVLNLYYFDEFANWFDENFSVNPRNVYYTATPVAGTLTPRFVTHTYKNKLMMKYSAESVPIKAIEGISDDNTLLMEYLSSLDSRRGNRWQQVFPELVGCL